MRIPFDQLLSFDTLPPSKSLVESIARYGQLVPILVTPIGDKFRVNDGKRRVEALRQLGKGWTEEVEAIVSMDLDDNILTLIGNLQRSQNPIAEGEAIQALLNSGWTKEDVSKNLGIPLQKIYSLLRLLHSLTPELKAKIVGGKMSCEAGRIAANLSEAEQLELAKNDKISIYNAHSARRTQQLSLLDLESVEIPKASELDSLLSGLTKLCTKISEGWERNSLVEAIRAIESLREKGEQ